MTDEMIKEHLSRRYVEILASRRGYLCLNPTADLGVDLSFSGHVRRREGTGFRYVKSDKHIDIQVKCTTERNIVRGSGWIKYDLKKKNYNDLIQRRGGIAPLLLVLVVLPDDGRDWVRVTPLELTMQRCAYWYLPDENASYTEATKVRIQMLDAHALTLDFFPERFIDHYGTAA